jgi:alpha-1,2-mannosyltransferase
VKQPARLDLVVAASFCALVGLYDIWFVVTSFAKVPFVAGPVVDVLYPDFLVFWAAADAFFQGKLAIVYDVDALTKFQNDLFHPDRFPALVKFRPFFYPPTWLLMVLPFALVGVATAYVVFMMFTAGAATALEGRRHGWGWLAVLTCPAAAWVILAGQNTFLSLALFYGGFRLLERRPEIAGILLGCLSYKPQIWILVPLALLAARQWRALAWTIGTVGVLSLASLLVFGAGTWFDFLAAAREMGTERVTTEMFTRVYMQMTTLLAAARMLALPDAVGSGLQLAGALLAVGAVWHAFRHYPSSDARLAILAVATFLVSPYTLNYDMLLLMPIAVALFRQGAATGFLPLERAVHAALWLMPTLSWALNQLKLPLTPVVVLLFGAIAWTRLTAPKVELPNRAAAR